MRSNSLYVVKNDSEISKRSKKDDGKNKKYLVRFTIFIVLVLFLGVAIFGFKNRISDIKALESNLNLQKQKIAEERILLEKTLSNEREELLKIKLEYEEKTKAASEMVDSLKEKESLLNQELSKVTEFKELLKKYVLDMYELKLDSIPYESKEDNDKGLDGGYTDEKKETKDIHSGLYDKENKEQESKDLNKILSVAEPDWFIKFDSLGEFNY